MDLEENMNHHFSITPQSQQQQQQQQQTTVSFEKEQRSESNNTPTLPTTTSITDQIDIRIPNIKLLQGSSLIPAPPNSLQNRPSSPQSQTVLTQQHHVQSQYNTQFLQDQIRQLWSINDFLKQQNSLLTNELIHLKKLILVGNSNSNNNNNSAVSATITNVIEQQPPTTSHQMNQQSTQILSQHLNQTQQSPHVPQYHHHMHAQQQHISRTQSHTPPQPHQQSTNQPPAIVEQLLTSPIQQQPPPSQSLQHKLELDLSPAPKQSESSQTSSSQPKEFYIQKEYNFVSQQQQISPATTSSSSAINNNNTISSSNGTNTSLEQTQQKQYSFVQEERRVAQVHTSAENARQWSFTNYQGPKNSRANTSQITSDRGPKRRKLDHQKESYEIRIEEYQQQQQQQQQQTVAPNTSSNNKQSQQQQTQQQPVIQSASRTIDMQLYSNVKKKPSGTYSFRNAIYIVLLDAKIPLTVNEICDRALQNGLVSTTSKTPHLSFSACISKESQSTNGLFKATKDGKCVELNIPAPDDPSSPQQQQHSTIQFSL